MELIKKGIPSVVFVTERFTALAKAVRTGKGMPDLPTIIVPMNPEFYPEGELEKVMIQVTSQFVDLVAPGLRARSPGTGGEQ